MQVTSMLSAGYLEPVSGIRSLSEAAALRRVQREQSAGALQARVASSRGVSASDKTDKTEQEAAELSRQEQNVLSQEQNLKARVGSGAEVHTVYHYTLGADGRRYITGASVTMKGDEADLSRAGGGVTTKDVQVKEDEKAHRVAGAEADDKSSSRRSDDATKNPKSGTDTTGQELSEDEEALVRELEQAQREVIAHEAAHQAAAGALGGGVSYSYTQGPDGKSYITGGEVPIQFREGATPEETLRNMQQVQRAATAPADPSGQDRRVAARAVSMAAEARQEIASERTQKSGGVSGTAAGTRTGNTEGEDTETEEDYDAQPSLVARGTPVIRGMAAAEDPSRNGVASILASIRASQIQSQLLPAA